MSGFLFRFRCESDMSYCGIDFGTSNSSVGVLLKGKPTLLNFDSKPTTPSAIFYCTESGENFFGQAAIKQYTSGYNGRLLRALKSVLGSSLIDEMTTVRNQRLAFRDIIRDYLLYLRGALDSTHETSTHSVVLGRPVHFVDDDEKKDRAAQNTLYEIVSDLGFKDVEFQFEPIAAALSYESVVKREEIALIVDIGGGTADFTLIKVSPDSRPSDQRMDDILATMGVHIGGTDFDRVLSLQAAMPLLGYGGKTRQTNRELPSSLYFDLATWHKIPTLYNNETLIRVDEMRLDAAEPEKIQRLREVIEYRQGHTLAADVEEAKIRLSDADNTALSLSMLSPPIATEILRKTMEQSIDHLVAQLIICIEQGVSDAQLSAGDIDTLFFTGGSSAIGVIRQRIQALFPQARVVQGDEFGSVGLGLAIDAHQKFG